MLNQTIISNSENLHIKNPNIGAEIITEPHFDMLDELN